MVSRVKKQQVRQSRPNIGDGRLGVCASIDDGRLGVCARSAPPRYKNGAEGCTSVAPKMVQVVQKLGSQAPYCATKKGGPSGAKKTTPLIQKRGSWEPRCAKWPSPIAPGEPKKLKNPLLYLWTKKQQVCPQRITMGALSPQKSKKGSQASVSPVAPKCTKKWSKKQQVVQNPHCLYYFCTCKLRHKSTSGPLVDG